MAFDLRRVFRSKTTGEFFLLGEEGILVCPYTFDQTVPSEEWIIVHNNNTTNIIVQVYIDDELVKPDEIRIIDGNSISIQFSTPVAGYANLLVYRIGAAECGVISNVTPTPTPSVTPSNTPSISVTPTNTVTPTPTATFVPSPTVTPTPTQAVTLSPTVTPSVTVTSTPAITPTLSGTPVITPTNTITPTVTPTVTPSSTPATTAPITPTPTSSSTPATTPAVTPTNTVTPTVTPTPSVTPSSIVASNAFTSGGEAPSPLNPGAGRVIDRFPFSSPFTNASSVGNLSPVPTDTVLDHAGHSALAPATGYLSGGSNPPAILAVVESFPFASPFSSVNNIGFLSQARERLTGQNAPDDGYSSGGALSSSPFITNRIDSFPFSSSFTTATDVGDLSGDRRSLSGHQSDIDGYTSGGRTSPTIVSIIDRFPFNASFTTATNIGDLSLGKYDTIGNSSSTDGYNAGGNPLTSGVDNFPFSSPFTTATSTNNLGRTVRQAAGQNSSSDGHVSGGTDNTPTPGIQKDRIDSYPFSSPFTTSTDIGNLFVARIRSAGHQG